MERKTGKRREMTSQKIKKLEEVEVKDSSRILFVVIVAVLVLAVGFLVYSFVGHYGGGFDFRDRDVNKGNSPFPNLEFGEESFDVLIDACVGSSDGDACGFDRDNETVSGICRQSRGESLVCMPEMQRDN